MVGDHRIERRCNQLLQTNAAPGSNAEPAGDVVEPGKSQHVTFQRLRAGREAVGAKQQDARAGRITVVEVALAQHLARLGVDQAEAKEILVVEQVQFVDGEPKTIGYQAWVDLQSCSQGKLAIKMSLLCGYKTGFTTPACDVPGLRN